MNLQLVLLLLIIKPVILIKTHYVLEEHPCESIKVMSYEDFDQLNNCTVVFGYVSIVFSAYGEPASYNNQLMENRTFPLR